MNRSACYLTVISFMLASCQALPVRPSARAYTTPTALSQGSTHLAPDGGISDKESLAVGYAFDGGRIQLYFTDPTNRAAKQLSGGLDGPLVAAIDSARLTVDAALYSLSLNSVRRALVEAHRRGVVVRLVMESDNTERFAPQALKDAGITVLGDRREGLMHNKFVVIDRSEVWTGSMNLTDEGAYADRNNLVRIRSTKVAADYLNEFNEMFVNDKFGMDGEDPTPYPHVLVDGTQLDIYFSPDDHVQRALIGLIENAADSIYFLAYSFTADPLSEAIQRRAKEGIKVSGVMDADQVATNIGTEYDALQIAGIDVQLDREPGLMHHKVIILDGKIVVLGSYNFTASAEKNNDENLIVIHSPTIAAEYLREFKRVYAAAQSQ
jgi:phosphatidylserine/phosphatidylglycerophosphate/cardiolipin synthase-like enzyme